MEIFRPLGPFKPYLSRFAVSVTRRPQSIKSSALLGPPFSVILLKPNLNLKAV
jgi:hypothetical protein